jgi:hypothetical protein
LGRREIVEQLGELSAAMTRARRLEWRARLAVSASGREEVLVAPAFAQGVTRTRSWAPSGKL